MSDDGGQSGVKPDASANGVPPEGADAQSVPRPRAAPAGGPGRQLREARERLGVSEREVAEALNLPSQVIEAMEADDPEALPGAVFARGYLRSYAKLLELDPDQLLNQYPVPEAEPEITQLAPGISRPWWQDNPLWPYRGLVFGALVLILLMVWLWPNGSAPALDDAPRSELPADRPGELREPGSLRTDESTLRPADDVGTGAAPAFAPSPAVPAAQRPTPAVPAGANLDAGAQPPPRGLDAGLPDGAQRLTATGSDRLTLSFSDDCWVEVRAADGASLYSDLSRGGSRLALVGQAPFRILLGYAPGVSLEFNGEAVPLSPHTRNNVATLVLGQ